eukprot:TRINITY_DN3927_c0_g1_i2.p1 TRINITY_DN3927_c0_g1~~TRINITY_DN3927_c0_g1_i2.p1  ORF type:complete len:265 (+),score=59.16 TRINITY_DN3927_c0_g1_i2:73-795(+)
MCIRDRIVEIPVCFLPASILRWRVLDPMAYATRGSVEGAVMALQRGWAINLSGGYHHASLSSGGGFCVYADITIVTRFLREFYPERIDRVMIVDLDAHQGNGHERDFIGDNNTYIVDMYNHRIYPGDSYAKQAISKDISVTHMDEDQEFLAKLRRGLGDALSEFTPSFLIYNAGTDCMQNDPLGNLELSPAGIVERDQIVFEMALSRNIPILMVLSGGYQLANAPCIADSVENLLRTLKR